MDLLTMEITMRSLLLSVLLLTSVGLSACVTYSPGSDTYTVDTSGSVEHGSGNRLRDQKPGY